MSERISLAVEGALATVTLNHPGKLNVLDRDAWVALAEVVRRASVDPSVGCVLIRGVGESAFSAGSDISVFPDQRQAKDDVATYAAAIEGAMDAILACERPTLAVIQGVCVGGGLEIAACCDLRLCGESSRFGAPIQRLGLTMSHAELSPLVRLLGPAGALEILIGGDIVGAERAERMGLVHRVVPDAHVLELGQAWARRIAGGAPLVNKWHKKFIRRLCDPAPLTPAERDEAYESFATEDYSEGVRAFIEKREPRFRGR